MEHAKIFNDLLFDSNYLSLVEKAKEYETAIYGFNLFNIYKGAIKERTISYLLAHILDSYRNFNLGNILFIKFIETIAVKNIPTEFKKLLTEGLLTEEGIFISAKTEWKIDKHFDVDPKKSKRYIDILIQIKTISGRILGIVAIETKLYSTERPNQISRYQKYLVEEFKDIPKFIIYLTPTGKISKTKSKDKNINENCPCFEFAYDCLSKITEVEYKNIPDGAKLFLEDFSNFIQKMIGYKKMNEIQKDILELYQNKNHRDAIKLIVENKPDLTWVKDELENKVKNKLIEIPEFKSEKLKIETSPDGKQVKVTFPNLKKFKIIGFMLRKIDSKRKSLEAEYIFVLAVGNKSFNHWETQEKNKIRNILGYPNPKDYSDWGNWIVLSLGGTYKLRDLGEKDLENLSNLMVKGISDCYEDVKKRIEEKEEKLNKFFLETIAKHPKKS